MMVDGKQSCSPENLQGVAHELRRLADQIAAGQVTVGGVTLSLCNAVSIKLKQKLVGGQVKFDISLTASLASEETTPADQATLHSPPKAGNKDLSPKSRPYEFKKLKKTLAEQWKQISNAIAAAKTPDAALQADFLRICAEYGQTAEEGWHPLWQEAMATMQQVLDLADQGNFHEASLLLTAVNNQKKACHKKYK